MTTKKSKNRLIKVWKDNARFFKFIGEFKYYKDFAQETINRLEETKPDKEKTLLEQMNKEQTEMYNYLQKVIKTNKL